MSYHAPIKPPMVEHGRGATTFLVACMKKTSAELKAANVEQAAEYHNIPVEWARFWIHEELHRAKRNI